MAFSFASPAPASQSPFSLTPQQQQPSPFSSFTPQTQQQQQQSPFSLTPQQPQQQSSLQLGFQSQQPPQQSPLQLSFQQQQQQQQLMLFTTDRSPATYSTKWEELHPDSQKLLLQIEEKILTYRDESERLDQCSRLYDSSVSNDSFELDANRIVQELGGTASALEREKASVQDLMTVVSEMMRNTEFAIRSYMMLRPRFIRPSAGVASSGSANPTGSAIGPGHSNQSMAMAPTFDFYSGIPKRPSLFMQNTVARFEKYLGECCKWIEELEQLVQMDNNKRSSDSLEALPKVMSNVHDYFVYVASKVENLHQYVESMKTAYLYEQRRRGDGNDPFLEANRREAAKEEAAARRVHPTLHLPASVQPAARIAGGTMNSPAQASTQYHQSLAPSAATSASAFSNFGTPFSAQSSSSNLFSTPAPSTTSNLFSTPGFNPQSTPFATPSTPLLGSVPTPGFGSTTPAFASTPAVGSSSLFSSSPFAGGATASGSSFGGGSKSRAKTRGNRR